MSGWIDPADDVETVMRACDPFVKILALGLGFPSRFVQEKLDRKNLLRTGDGSINEVLLGLIYGYVDTCLKFGLKNEPPFPPHENFWRRVEDLLVTAAFRLFIDDEAGAYKSHLDAFESRSLDIRSGFERGKECFQVQQRTGSPDFVEAGILLSLR